MKKLGLVICAVLISSAVFSQVETAKKEEVKIEREIKMTEVNGVKTLYVTSIINGEVINEQFVGAKAEAKLAEIEKEEVKAKGANERVVVRKKVMTKEEEQEMAKPLEQQRRD